MTKEELKADVSSLLFDFPKLSETTAYAICCDHYETEELLELKRKLGLNDEEFIETIKFIEQRGGLKENRVGDNQKPVDASRTDGRGNSDPEEVMDEMEDDN